MKTLNLKNKQGFTIIEVVLVLAIAGLIFLMVFIALPALQRGQRDTLRKRQANSVITAVTNFSANNRRRTYDIWGDLSGSYNGDPINNLIDRGYLKEDEMRDSSTGEVYKVRKEATGGSLYSKYQNVRLGEYGVDTGYCVGNTPTDSSGETHGAEQFNWVFVFALENGGWVCASNRML